MAASPLALYLVRYLGHKEDHNSLFVETKDGERGDLAVVVGSTQQGMAFRYKAGDRHPQFTETIKSMQLLGWVESGKLTEFKKGCEEVPPPAKQWELMKLLVPHDQLRNSQHWVADVVSLLRTREVLTPLRDGDFAGVAEVTPKNRI